MELEGTKSHRQSTEVRKGIIRDLSTNVYSKGLTFQPYLEQNHWQKRVLKHCSGTNGQHYTHLFYPSYIQSQSRKALEYVEAKRSTKQAFRLQRNLLSMSFSFRRERKEAKVTTTGCIKN